MLAFREGNSWFHRLDPITKFLWISVISIWMLGMRDLAPIVLTSLTIFAIAVIGAHISLVRYFKITGLLLIGGIYLILFQGLFRPGPGVDIWIFHFSYVGMELGISLTLRTFGLVAASLAFSTTTRPKDVALALIRVGMPYRFAHVAYLGLRFLPLIEADMRTIIDAQRLRGVTGRWTMIKKMIIALVATELRRAEETAIALETRAFGLHETQTQLEKVPITRGGVILLAITLGIVFIYTF
jgi:energy-coupling factor transport system permease protein